jgi:superfamily I DNA/RNA helicase
LTDALASALQDVHVGFGRGLDDPVALLEAALSKGLEFDGVVVVEPGRIARESPQGLHALYVALTRATQRLTVVYSEPLPVELGA